MANNRKYSAPCVQLARTRSYGLSVFGNAGVGFNHRQINRRIASARMVIPNDLCRASMASFFMPSGRSSAISARVTCTAMRMTISQCNSCETEPQRAREFLMAMALSLSV